MDMQYATNANPDKNPYLAEHFLDEIHAAHRHSRGCFLLVSFYLLEFFEKSSERISSRSKRHGRLENSSFGK